MKTTIVSALLLLTTSISTIAQNLIAVQNNATPTFFTNLDSAIVHAQNGDTIYIPGGSFPLSVTINKRIHIVGVGQNADSTTATNISKVTGDFIIIAGASDGSLSGLELCPLRFGTSSSNQNIVNYKISRCNIGFIATGYSTPSSAINNTFTENIIAYIDGLMSQNNVFLNNFIGVLTNFSNNNSYKNNVFFGGYSHCLSSGSGGGNAGSNSIFENNIIIWGGLDATNSILNNNLFIDNVDFSQYPTNIASNNIVNQAQSTIFINQSGYTFNSAHDYHLKATCLGKNAGKDGSDIGIYGGAFPWKEGSVPFNPHIQSKQISATTDNNGNLPVNIKVKAQDN